ncbi:AAA family ATPase [Candidatus Bathyarchaeota archaeon]|nr:AAA family ATPase [Candidatus Bathyarchaeota archaeon]
MTAQILTGCGCIDKGLGGGIALGSIALIYGEPETGKTTLTLQCAVNCANQNLKTLFLDCDNTFTIQRLAQITPDRLEEIAEYITLIRPRDFSEQMAVIEQLSDYITRNFGMVVIDTVTSLYSAETAESSKKAFKLNRELNRQMAILAQMTKTQKIAVVVTSQVRSVFNETNISVEPVAKRVLKFWAERIVALKPTTSLQIIKAEIEKTPNKTQSTTCQLRIEESGIRDYRY